MTDQYRKSKDHQVVIYEHCSHCNQLQTGVERRQRKYAWMHDEDQKHMLSCQSCYEADAREADQRSYMPDYYC